jgi:hypothetical protein
MGVVPIHSRGEAGEEAGGKKRRGLADTVIDIVTALAETTIFDGEHTYVVFKEGQHVQCMAIRSAAFRRWVSLKLRQAGLCAPSRDALDRAVLTLEGAADALGRQDTPSIRVVGATEDDEPVVYLDLGDTRYRAARVTGNGWKVVNHPAEGPYFYRPPRIAALPTPASGGGIHDLWRFINVTRPDDRMLFLTWLVFSLWPHGPYPVLTVFGEQGATKTSVQVAAKALTDPTISRREIKAPTSLRRPPRDERDIEAAAYSSRLLAFDNVSFLDTWLSDVLCRLATGAELGGRTMYSNFDESVFSAVRPVMLNGIPDVLGQSDLADRTVRIECVAPEVRIGETQLWRDFEEARPKLLGSLLDLLSAAIANYGRVVVPEDSDIRMPDFVRVGEAIGLRLGWEAGALTQAYRENRAKAAQEIAELDPIFAPLEELLAWGANETWKGTAAELLTALTQETQKLGGSTRDMGWPKNAKGMSNKLRRLRPALAKIGIEVGVPQRSNGRTTVTIRRVV